MRKKRERVCSWMCISVKIKLDDMSYQIRKARVMGVDFKVMLPVYMFVSEKRNLYVHVIYLICTNFNL